MTFRYLKPAREELEGAIAFLDEQQEGLGVRFLHEVNRAIARILEMPTTWPLVSPNARKFNLRTFSYSVVYDVEDDEVVIIAIAHQRRKAKYWMGRR